MRRTMLRELRGLANGLGEEPNALRDMMEGEAASGGSAMRGGGGEQDYSLDSFSREGTERGIQTSADAAGLAPLATQMAVGVPASDKGTFAKRVLAPAARQNAPEDSQRDQLEDMRARKAEQREEDRLRALKQAEEEEERYRRGQAEAEGIQAADREARERDQRAVDEATERQHLIDQRQRDEKAVAAAARKKVRSQEQVAKLNERKTQRLRESSISRELEQMAGKSALPEREALPPDQLRDELPPAERPPENEYDPGLPTGGDSTSSDGTGTGSNPTGYDPGGGGGATPLVVRPADAPPGTGADTGTGLKALLALGALITAGLMARRLARKARKAA